MTGNLTQKLRIESVKASRGDGGTGFRRGSVAPDVQILHGTVPIETGMIPRHPRRYTSCLRDCAIAAAERALIMKVLPGDLHECILLNRSLGHGCAVSVFSWSGRLRA